ncbi:MAG: histidinol-phosphate transaminase [Candidatus Acidiferrum sp.]
MKVRLPVRKAILERKTYESPAEGRLNKVRLDFNENTSGCPPAVVRALRRITPKQFAMYPEYSAGTKRIARHFGVGVEELLLTNGGDDALRVFFDAFVETGSSILVCEPTFAMYRYFAEIAGARIEALRYGAKMEFPMNGVLQALRAKPRVLFIANPNNPTGTQLIPAEIVKLLDAAPETAVVIDEAYADFSGVSMVPWIRKYPQLFIARTFSKIAGLAALRLGAVIAAAPSLAMLRRAMPPYPVNIAALVAAQAAVDDRQAMLSYAREVKRLRTWLTKELAQLHVQTFPSGGNFLLANFGPSGPALFRSLKREGILLRDRSRDFGPGFVRISMGTDTEMQRLLRLIRKKWKVTA